MNEKRVLMKLSYVLFFLVCFWFQLVVPVFREDKLSLMSICINIFILIIIGYILNKARKNYFNISEVLIKDLKDVEMQIESDSQNQQVVTLWDLYKNNDGLFRNDNLNEKYQEFVNEAKRLERKENVNLKCCIDDYINEDLIEEIVNKRIYSLVSNAMTGLGILGTFIGLVLGLSGFKTSTSEEITSSITPLMEGIKVAFLTSIFGMVTSLLFSYYFKRNNEQLNKALYDFIDAFEKHIYTNADNDNLQQILIYQKKQADNIEKLALNIGEKIAGEIASVMAPQFNRMNDTIESFANVASKNQVDGVGQIVDKFVGEMNSALGNSFLELGNTIKMTSELQRQGNSHMKEVLNEVCTMTTDIKGMNESLENTLTRFETFIKRIDELQALLNDHHESLLKQMEENYRIAEKQKEYIEKIVEYENKLTNSVSKCNEDILRRLRFIQESEREFTNLTRENVQYINQNSNEQMKTVNQYIGSICGQLDKSTKQLKDVIKQMNGQLANSLNQTFGLFDKNLAEITTRLSGTILEVNNTTQRVPGVVKASYEEIEKTFDVVNEEMKLLVLAMQELRKNLEIKLNQDNEMNKRIHRLIDKELVAE